MLACGPAPRANDAQSVVAQKMMSPDGVALVIACTPTGKEICFNAIDDNCNGVIDEGCGVATGVLQFTIAWGDSSADVDLVVTDPTGTKTSKDNKSTPGGLRLDRACGGKDDGCHGQKFENVYFEGNEPPRGKYLVEVKLADLRGAESPVKVRVGARVGSRTFGADLALAPGGQEDKKVFTFEL